MSHITPKGKKKKRQNKLILRPHYIHVCSWAMLSKETARNGNIILTADLLLSASGVAETC